jgi:GDP-4-dehydro-6-deoxy-D-mannose reductase
VTDLPYITGKSGFVGSHFPVDCKALVDTDGKLDLRDRDQVARAVARVPKWGTVVHLAAQAFVPRSFDDPRETFDINFLGTLNLLEALKAKGFSGRFLQVGSGDIYGLVDEADMPIVEEQPLRPRSPYGVSKVAAEALVHQWAVSGCGFECVMARTFNHIGPRQSPRFAVADFAKQIIAIKQGRQSHTMSVGDIDTTRDFTDVRDVVDAYLTLVERGKNGAIYNVCSGQELSLRKIIKRLAELAGTTVDIQIDESRLRKSEQRRVRGSYKKLAQDTGWQPKKPLDKTLSDILECWENEDT